MPINPNQVTIYVSTDNRKWINRLLWELAQDGTLPQSKQNSLSAMVSWLVKQELERRGIEQNSTPNEKIE